MANYDVTTAAASLEYDTVQGDWPTLHQVDANHFINFYNGSADDGFADILVVNTTTWAVTTVTTRLEFDTADDIDNFALAIPDFPNYFLNLWTGVGTDGFAQVFTVNTTTWAVTTAAGTLEFDTQNASSNMLLAIDSTHFLNVWNGGAGGQGTAQVFTVNTTTWAVTTAATTFVFDTESAGYPTIAPIDANHFLANWQGGTNEDLHAVTLVVNTTTWAVSTAAAEAIFDSDNFSGPYGKRELVVIDSNHFLRAWESGTVNGFDGYIRVQEVNTTTWAVSQVGTAALEFDTQDATEKSIVKIDASHFIMTWSGAGFDGFAQVFAVVVPTGSSVSPSASVSASVSPSPSVSASISPSASLSLTEAEGETLLPV